MAIHAGSPVEELTKVGKTTASRLKKLGIRTAEDLLFYFPSRYEDFSRITPLPDVTEGQETTVEGIVQLISARRTPRKRMLLTQALLHDGNGYLRIIWFNQPYIAKQLEQGTKIRCSGKIERDASGLVMRNPQYEQANKPCVHTGRILAVYPLTDGLTNKQLRFLQTQCQATIPEIVDWMPAEVLESQNLLPIAEALQQIHFPDSLGVTDNARRRFQFQELLLMHLHTLHVRARNTELKAHTLPFNQDLTQTFTKSLPWPLTDDQKKTLWAIFQDMEQPTPMNRLLEGDVGSGKTVVAAGAMHAVASQNKQAVLMAPTSILAEQHAETLANLFEPFVLRLGLITGSTVAIYGQGKRTALTKKDASEVALTADVLVGTHALFSKGLTYRSIGLAIIDEQHRFGVEQRKALMDKNKDGLVPHMLSMTATPIPRTLSLTVFGDLEISALKEKPAGRQPIITRVLHGAEVTQAYDAIEQAVAQGRQAFVICPLIEENESLQSKAALTEAETLKKKVFPSLRIDVLHGKMKPEEKEAVMKQMEQGEIDILVCTSLVEVGIDIPNATIMLIEGAERFGLAQLHQFRGRIGRGEHASTCFLRSDSRSPDTMERLRLLEQSNDGFVLAEKDLEIRGPGAMIGKEQSGFGFLSSTLFQDPELIEMTRKVAEQIFTDVKKNRHKLLKKRLEELEKKIILS